MAININPYYGSTNTTITGSNNIAIGNATLGNYGTSFNTTIAKAKYHILGEDVEIDGYIDGTTAMMIATLNVLGKPYYEELKKNNVSFSNKIEEYLKARFKVLERDTKIDSILEEKNSIEPPTF
jgi:hypothetical protein